LSSWFLTFLGTLLELFDKDFEYRYFFKLTNFFVLKWKSMQSFQEPNCSFYDHIIKQEV